MRDVRVWVAAAFGLLFWVSGAAAQNIYSGGKTGAYYGTICPAIGDGLAPEGFTATCVETNGSLDNIQRLLADPAGLALVQTDAFANWAMNHPDDAKKLVTVRADLASEGVYFVSKNVTSFANLVRFITRIKLVLPPKSSGPALTFENMKHTLGRVFGRLEDNQVIYADSATAAIEKALSSDNTIALFVQLPDPANANFKLIVEKQGHFIPVVARALVDEKIGDVHVYTVETRTVKAGGIFTSGLDVTTLASPIMIIANVPDALPAGSNARQNYDDMIKAVKTLPRESLLPKTGSAASLFSKVYTATSGVTQDLVNQAETAIKGM
jgi:hypothetical protein